MPVLSGIFSLCELRETNFQDTYPGAFHYSVMNLASLWGCHNLGAICKENLWEAPRIIILSKSM